VAAFGPFWQSRFTRGEKKNKKKLNQDEEAKH
jgi:hypothetical protein